MASAGSYRQFVKWDANDVSPRVVDIGPAASVDRTQAPGIGVLRVSHIDGPYDACTAIVRIGDNGTRLGPIDVPFTLIAETPMTVELTPVAGRRSRDMRINLAVTPVCCPVEAYATKTYDALLNEIIPLPQWVRRVSTVGTVSRFDYRVGGVVLAATLTGSHDRPTIADDIIVTTAGPVMFHY
jgi:hypothetical protein